MLGEKNIKTSSFFQDTASRRGNTRTRQKDKAHSLVRRGGCLLERRRRRQSISRRRHCKRVVGWRCRWNSADRSVNGTGVPGQSSVDFRSSGNKECLELDGLLVGGHRIAKLLACAAATSRASLLVNINDVGRAANHRVGAAGFVLPLMNSITIAAITLSN